MNGLHKRLFGTIYIMISKTQTEELLTDVFKDIDGQQISKQAIYSMESFSLAHSYGEAPLQNFFKAMDMIIKPTDTTFYDLGSGLGKKVMATALSYNVSNCVGIEVITQLFDESIKALTLLHKKIPELLSKNISFINADYYDCDFSHADIVYISIMPQILEAELKGTLLEKLCQLRFGSRVITSQIPIRSTQFEFITSIPDPIQKGAIGELYLHMRK
jgi:hypothetical protein